MEKPEYYDSVLELFDQGLLRSEIAEKLNIKPAALSWQMKKHGFSFSRESYTLSQKQIDEAVRLYSDGMSTPKIAELLGTSKSNISYALKLRGVTMKTKKELKFYGDYSINEDAFSDLTTEESAYFYGWLLTDGWIRKDNVSIELSRKDEELLYNFKDYMGSSNKIFQRTRLVKPTGNYSDTSSFGFSHEPILERLKTLGLKERKSLEETCPDVFKYNRHFWRGVVEGDGHIARSAYSVEICGGERLTEDFAKFCSYIDSAANVYIGRNGKMFTAKVGKKFTTKAILDELYRDCKLKLSRKYNVYLERYYDGFDPN